MVRREHCILSTHDRTGRTKKNMKAILESKLPSAEPVDVLVVGGGPAGVAAAFSAARQGADTLLIEQFNCLGGVATAGGHGYYCILCEWGGKRRIAGGIPLEIGQRVDREGYGKLDHNGIMFEVEGMKFVLEKMAAESGVKLLYHTFFVKTLTQDGQATGAVVCNKNGLQVIRARRVVDCTGDGDAAASAGAQFQKGRPSDGKCQPVTLMFTIGGVDWMKVQSWRTNYQMEDVWRQAQANGDMEPFQTQIMGFWWTPTRPDQAGINFTHVNGVDSCLAKDLTAATIEARRQAWHCIDVFRKYVPGMENAYMVSTAATIGIRESRRILGETVLTEQHMMEQRAWSDSIGYGSFFIDIHNIDGPGMDATTHRPEPGFKYQIPYGILVPKEVDNLLTAGRCVSVSHVALGSLRVMVQCMITGQAAGTAAALSLQDGVAPRQLDVQKLQGTLRASGCIVDESDFSAANGG